MMLSEEFLSIVADRKSLDDLEEVEIIFQPIHQLGGLSKCYQLRSLSLISTGLSSISGLAPVASTLTELCLTDQELMKIEGLEQLANLRKLFLHRNKIEKIENLDGCSSLQVLWLSSNRIKQVENLETIGGSLQELWLQDNLIEEVSNLEYLACLKKLSLAGNPLQSFESIRNIARIPQLQAVSLEDTMFIRCPVTHAEGYRAFLLCSMMHLEMLDGKLVTKEECRAARDMQRHLLKEFNQRIQIASDEADREIHRIRAQGARQKNSAREMNKLLMGAFNDLEACVMAGRRKVQETVENDAKVRMEAKKSLEASLQKLQTEFDADVEDMIARNEKKMEERLHMVDAVTRRTAVEYRLASCLANLPSRGSFATQLERTTSESRTIIKFVKEAASACPDSDRLSVLQVYSLYSQSKLLQFRDRVFSDQNPKHRNRTDVRIVYVALAIPPEGDNETSGAQFHDLVADNFILSGADPNGPPVLLFADPLKALQHADIGYAGPAKDRLGQGQQSSPPHFGALFECELHISMEVHKELPDVHGQLEVAGITGNLGSHHVSGQFEWLDSSNGNKVPKASAATSATLLPHDPCTVYAVRSDTTCRANLLVQTCLVCEIGSPSTATRSAEEFLAQAVLPQHICDPRLATRVQKFQADLDAECQEFQKKLLYNLDPQSAGKLQEASSHLKQAKADVRNLRKQVDQQREQQRRVLSSTSS